MVALLLQQSSLLAKKYRDLMYRKSGKLGWRGEERRVEEKRGEVVRRGDTKVAEVGLSTSCYGEETVEPTPRVQVPVYNLNSEAERGHWAGKAATPEPKRCASRRNSSPRKGLLEAGIFGLKGHDASGSSLRRNAYPPLGSYKHKYNDSDVFTPPKAQSPLRVKWLVRPL